MYILAIETTGGVPSAALIETETGKCLEKRGEGKLNHLKTLLPLTEELLFEAGRKKSELSAVAVSAGPGSFTGIRVGVSTARALSQGLSIPAIAVPTLRSFLYNDRAFTGVICPIFDAKRSQIYGAGFYKGGEAADEATEDVAGGAYGLSDFLKLLEAVLCERAKERASFVLRFCGDGIRAYGSDIENWAGSFLESLRASLNCDIRLELDTNGDTAFQRAGSVAKLAADMYRRDPSVLVAWNELLPMYMRRSEAEIKLENGTLGGGKKKVQAKYR